MQLTPYILLRRADGSCTTDEEATGYFIRCRWLRSGSRQRTSSGQCSVHTGTPAMLQSVQFKTYHCSPECFVASWRESQRQRALGHGECRHRVTPTTAARLTLTRPCRASAGQGRRLRTARHALLQAQPLQHEFPQQQHRHRNMDRGASPRRRATQHAPRQPGPAPPVRLPGGLHSLAVLLSFPSSGEQPAHVHPASRGRGPLAALRVRARRERDGRGGVRGHDAGARGARHCGAPSAPSPPRASGSRNAQSRPVHSAHLQRVGGPLR